MNTPQMPPSPIDVARRELGRPPAGWRMRLYTVIFEADTRAGRAFDLALIAFIVASVAVVVLDSVAVVHQRHGAWLKGLEWFFTLAFTVEYIARLLCVRHPLRYARSFFGIIDLLAILPTYLAMLVPGLHALIDVRLLRLLRLFRLLKPAPMSANSARCTRRWRASRRKIAVFLSFVLLVVMIMGTLMYVVEGPDNGFTSIPVGVYWAITTMTTVGFGDITPKTDLGRLIASRDDADGLGHAGRAHGHRQRRAGGAAQPRRHHHAHLPRVPERGPPAQCALLPRLRRKTSALPARRQRLMGRHASH